MTTSLADRIEMVRNHATIDPADIRWRVGQISKKDAHKGSLLGYIDARTCMEALDALDPEWSAVHGDPIIVGGELVGVPCRVTVNGVTRSDVGMPSSQEPIKGAYSDALKRAAVHFGIGRELYELPRIYVKLDDYKKPVAIPTYHNGRWTLPPGAGSVFYDREPDEQPERGSGGRQAAGARRASAPAPAPARTPEEQHVLDEILALPGMTHARMSLLADQVGVEKGRRASYLELVEILEAAQQPLPEQPAEVPSAGVGEAEDARASASPDISHAADEGTSPSDAATPAGSSSPPGATEPAAPSIEDVLAVTGGEEVPPDGSNITIRMAPPPKPGTKAYRDLPSGTERAAAKQWWDAQKAAEPQQESLAEALGAPTSD